MAGVPGKSLAEDWLALFELFPSKDGIKLRVPIPETAILKDAKIIGWFYTSKEGVVSRASTHEVSSDALLHKFLVQQVIDVVTNPFAYVAVAHYDTGVARLLRRPELQALLLRVSGPYEPVPVVLVSEDRSAELPFCVQQYVPPYRDLRYIATYAGSDNCTCTTFARKYSSRYTHPFDDADGASEAVRSGSPPHHFNGLSSGAAAAAAASLSPHLRPASALSVDVESRSLTAEEMLVESQLIALGLLEPRDPMAGRSSPQPGATAFPSSYRGWSAAEAGRPADIIAPASRQMKVDVARAVQNIMSYVERAHGLRLQGLVAEFIKAPDGSILFTGVHAVQLDARASRGRLGTFTERWGDFLTGMGPTPAPRASSRKYGSPALLMTRSSGGDRSGGGSGLMMTDRAMSAGAAAAAAAAAANSMASGFRPGSAPPLHMFNNRFKGGASSPTSAANGHYTLRNAVSAGRKGAGGSPTAMPPQSDSYPLWSSRGDGLASETVVSALALELEAMKDRLQHQTDVAARAEAALHQLASTCQIAQATLSENLGAVRGELESVLRAKRESDQEAGRLRADHRGIREQLVAAEGEVDRLRHDLDRDRETLATAVRSSQVKEENMDGEVGRLRDENEELSRRLGHASRRLDEEQEVVEAVRAQLYDYKAMVQTMQVQMRRGKSTRNNPNGTPAGGMGGNFGGGVGASTSFAPGDMGGGGGGGGNGGATRRGQEGGMDGGDQDGGYNESPTRPQSGGFHSGGPGSMSLNHQNLAALSAASNAVNATSGGGGGGSGGAMLSPGAKNGKSGGGSGARRPVSGEKPSARSSIVAAAPWAASAPDLVLPASGFAPAPSSPTSVALVNVLVQATAQNRGRFPRYSQPSGALAAAAAAATNAGAAAAAAGPNTVSFNVAETVGTDHPAAELAESRRQRRMLSMQSDPGLALSTAYGAAPANYASPTGLAIGLASASSAVTATGDQVASRIINWDMLKINDLIVPENGLPINMKQMEGVAKIGRMLRESETELRDIFAYYGTLNRVVVVDSQVCLTEQQFIKFAREVGLMEELLFPDALEEIFRLLADKSQTYHYGLGRPDTDHILFEVFPEVICRMAAIKFDWHPVDPLLEADMKSETQSEFDEPVYSSKPSGRTPSPTRAAATGSTPTRKRPDSAGDNGSGSDSDGGGGMTEGLGCRYPSPPPVVPRNTAPAEVVIYTMVKAFLFLSVLAKARRYKITGASAARDRAKGRKTPLETWIQ